MPEQSNAALIAEARRYVSDHDVYADNHLLRGLADALEAAVWQRDNWKLSAEEAEHAEKRWKDRAIEAERELQVAEDQANNLAGDLAQAEKERDALADAVESAVATGDQAWGTGNFDWYDLRDILATPATAPADALREHDAKVRAEALREFAGVVREIAALGPQNSGLRTPDHLAEYAANYADRIEKEAGR